MDILVVVGLAAIALAVLRANFWRAVLFLWPSSIQVEPEEPGDKMSLPEALEPLSRLLIGLGFEPLGSRMEKPRLGRALLSYDYAHAAQKVFATLYLGRDGQPRLYFLTPIEGGGFVLTSNYRRPAKEIPGHYLSGALEELPPERIFRAHVRRLEPFQPRGELTQEARVAAAREWFAGPGGPEVRQQNLHGLLWSLGTVGMVVAALFGKR